MLHYSEANLINYLTNRNFYTFIGTHIYFEELEDDMLFLILSYIIKINKKNLKSKLKFIYNTSKAQQ